MFIGFWVLIGVVLWCYILDIKEIILVFFNIISVFGFCVMCVMFNVDLGEKKNVFFLSVVLFKICVLFLKFI